MSSSRSIAAARNRRTGDSALQSRTPNKQPVTSINSQRAFSQQPPPYANNAVPAPNAKSLPFSKLTVSDAVGLITLRLGKVEQYLIDTQNSDSQKSVATPTSGLDNSVISTIVNRLDSLEKQNMNANVEMIDQLAKEVSSVKKMIQSLQAEIANIKSDVNTRFNDIDFAFEELEKNLEAMEEPMVEELMVEELTAEELATEELMVGEQMVEASIIEDPIVEDVVEADKEEQKGRKGKKGKKGDKPNSIDLSGVENSIKSEEGIPSSA
uniref:Uncharacterized protein n=1 Tax=viral metagenome TaxID=1070528 RepID=A0A6C0LMV1_9ZZZZ